jgi:hypothetical protein
MNIHEYQAKELLAKFGVPVPAGHAAMSVDEAVEAAKTLPGPLWVVKAQIHAGGRGKGKFTELLELALAPPARVDLCFDDPQWPGKLFCRFDRFVDAHRRMARRHRHAELLEQLFCLIFVDVHRGGP